MDKEVFVNRVLARMPEDLYKSENCSLEEFFRLKEELGRMHTQGWTISDACIFIRNTEYASPNLDEAIALKRMERVSAKYK